MLVDEAIRQRRTITQFLDEPVSASDLREMLALASLAPSIGNRQMWRYVVIVDPNLRRMLADLVERRINEMEEWPEAEHEQRRLFAWRRSSMTFRQAPAVIVVINQGYRCPLEQLLVEHGEKQPDIERMFAYPDMQSIGGMIGFLTLAAVDRGYGTCWLTGPLLAQRDLQASLELQLNESVAAIVGLGKTEEHPLPKTKKPIDTLIEWR